MLVIGNTLILVILSNLLQTTYLSYTKKFNEINYFDILILY